MFRVSAFGFDTDGRDAAWQPYSVDPLRLFTSHWCTSYTVKTVQPRDFGQFWRHFAQYYVNYVILLPGNFLCK